MLAVGPSSSDAAASSPAADPLFSPGSGPERPATAMPPHPKAQPTLASFFGAKKQISPPEPAQDAAASAPAPALVAAALGSGEELVGCAVEILWESDREWYSGTVQSCTPAGAHVIDYEDGSNVTHDMSKMQYRVLARPGNPRAAQSSDPPERTAAAPVESAPAPLAPIFGAAKKTARAADQTAASQKAAAGPLAPIFGKPGPKRKASTEEPSRSSTTAKVKRERAAAAQPQAQTTKPTKSAPAKEAAAPHTGKVPDLFLTKKQKQEREERLRKQEQEESLRKLREQQERNRVVDEALRKGKATNPFFEQRPAAREPARSDNCPQLERCDASSPLFATLPWLLPGGVAHIAQRQQPSQPSARPVLPAKALRDSALSSHVPARTSLLPQGREREREHLRTAASQPVCSFLYHPLEDGAIEEFARSLPVIKLLCGESKDYSALGRAAKVLVNTFHRCLGWRYGRVRTASGEPRTRTAHDLWTVLYRPMCAADVCGNRQDVARLATWLQRMKSNMMTAKQNPVRKYKNGSDSDYESDDFADSAANGSYARLSAKDQSALWETSTEFNVVLLSGPAGCGKSAAIHAASQECGYSIIEMNASEKRTGKAVQAKCGEATQSHGLQKWQGMAAQEISPPESSEANSLKRKSAGSKLALKKKAKTADSSSLAATSDGSPEASLIVFEEVDVLFDDDQGFFAALSTLESTTKRPIVMTSSSTFIEGLPDRLPTLNSAFEAPSAKEIRDLLRCICLVEGVDVRANEAENLVERFNCDMRALLMDAQMRFQGEAGLLVSQQANRPSRKARQQTDHTEEPAKVKLSVENVVRAQDIHVLPGSMAASDILDVLARTTWSIGEDLPAAIVGKSNEIHFDEWLHDCVEATRPARTDDPSACSSVLQDIADLGWFFSVTDVANAGEELSSCNMAGGLKETDRQLYLSAAMLHASTSKLRQRVGGSRTDASEVTTASAETSVPAAAEVPRECYVRQSPMTLQRAAEARGVNTLMREPHVATRSSELLDYAGWAHPLAAADVLAGETTEKRRFMYHLRSSADLSDKQVKELGRPRFTASAATTTVAA